MTVLAAVCTKMPEAKLAVIFLPMFTFTAASVRCSRHCSCRTSASGANPPVFVSLQALKAIVALDTAGVLLGWKFFDHAAHLGGALFGV